jgi:hypothetical protein
LARLVEEPATAGRGQPGTAARFSEFATGMPRLPIYVSTFVLLGALAVPAILAHKRLSRAEKAFLCAAGVLQTLLCLAILVGFVCWIVSILRHAWSGQDLAPGRLPF